MDPISHALLGRTLAHVYPAQTPSRGVRTAAILGSLAPDIDLIVAFQGWDRYLYVHQIGTHALVAAPILALAVALTVRVFVRQSRVSHLALAALAGVVIGHLMFDLVSGSEMRLFVPFAQLRLGPHWIAMADLLAVSILVAGTIWSIWRPRRAAAWTLAALTLLIVVKAESQTLAVRAIERHAAGRPDYSASRSDAVNGSLVSWKFFARDGQRVQAWRVNAVTGAVTLDFERQTASNVAGLSESTRVPAVQTFLGLAMLPFIRVEHADNRTLLLWSDLRDCSATRCDLSFGASIDPNGKPISEVIRIGPFEQVRPLPPD